MIVDGMKDRGKCDNCGRVRPLMNYSLTNIEFDICEDCGNALSNMFHMSMENLTKQIYDEVSERVITNLEGEIA